MAWCIAWLDLGSSGCLLIRIWLTLVGSNIPLAVTFSTWETILNNLKLKLWDSLQWFLLKKLTLGFLNHDIFFCFILYFVTEYTEKKLYPPREIIYLEVLENNFEHCKCNWQARFFSCRLMSNLMKNIGNLVLTSTLDLQWWGCPNHSNLALDI